MTLLDQPLPSYTPPLDLVALDQLTRRETATIRVNGADYTQWESVWVQHRWTEAYPIFRFTAAEFGDGADVWTDWKVKPGDDCVIYLGEQPAITGVVTVRQAAYDANNHGVTIQGIGLTWYAARASHLDKDGNFDNMSFQQIVERVLAPFDSKATYVGTPDPTPFKHEQISPGETIWDFFERLGRMIGVVIGSDPYGNFVFISDHVGQTTAVLEEGVNILRCQAIISMENPFSVYVVRNQQPASDDTNGTDASEQEASAPGTAKHYSPLLTPSEEPVTIDMLQKRAHNEAVWHEGTIIQVIITVQGWYRPDGRSLWRTGERAHVISPSIPMDMDLVIQTATFTQDRNQGTLTTLELVAPWLLKDIGPFAVDSGVPQEPGGATINTGPPTTPPTQPAPQPPASSLQE